MRCIAVPLALLFLFPAQIFAAQPPGGKVKVYHDGRKYQGRLLAANAEVIVITEKKSGEVIGFPVSEVSKVYVRKSKVVAGVLTGLVIGAGLTGLMIITFPRKADSLGGALGLAVLAAAAIGVGLVFTVFMGVGGGLFGSLFGWKKIRLSRLQPQQREQALRRLARYAAFGSYLPEEFRSYRIITR